MAGTNVNPKSPAWYGGGLGGILRPGANQGDVIYVDGTGPDTNDGRTPTTPLATFLAALALCTNDRNDTIIVLDYFNAAGEGWPITVNKSMVSIIGVPLGGGMWPQINPTGDVAGLYITAAGVEVCNLSINAGGTSACVEMTAAPVWGIEIHNCWFGELGTGQDGIRMIGPYAKVWGCRFGLGLTRHGVQIVGNATRGMVGEEGKEPNLFRALPSACITTTNQFAQGWITNNRFSVADAANGEAIELPATCNGVNVDGNRAFQGQAATAFNPFRDLGTNCWGLNYDGLAPVYPVMV